ncbi:glycoside hydrolase family 16 protein [Rhodobacteraceae bacterium]|nr:glycoside hydrolase family 16 protein [Paracoccaceae bacterium]
MSTGHQFTKIVLAGLAITVAFTVGGYGVDVGEQSVRREANTYTRHSLTEADGTFAKTSEVGQTRCSVPVFVTRENECSEYGRNPSLSTFASTTALSGTDAVEPADLLLDVPDIASVSDEMSPVDAVTARIALRETFNYDFSDFSIENGRTVNGNSVSDDLVWSTVAFRNFPPDNNARGPRTNNNQESLTVDPLFAGTTGVPLGLNPFSVNAEGNLVITASARPAEISAAELGTHEDTGQEFTVVSGALTSWPSFKQRYGYFEFRARMPNRGQGSWPALWMRGDNTSGQWPKTGEIDILEVVDEKLYQVIHYGESVKLRENSGRALSGFDDFDNFHSYGVLWTEDYLVFYVDQKAVHAIKNTGQIPDEQFMLITLQVGGNWPGSHDPSDLPFTMELDYARAYSIMGR